MGKTCELPADNHSDDIVEVWHGMAEPMTLCGFHAHNLTPQTFEAVRLARRDALAHHQPRKNPMPKITITLQPTQGGDQTWDDVRAAVDRCTPIDGALKVRDGLSDPIDTHVAGFHVTVNVEAA